MTTFLTELFTGSNGTPWSDGWSTIGFTPTLEIQSNKGRVSGVVGSGFIIWPTLTSTTDILCSFDVSDGVNQAGVVGQYNSSSSYFGAIYVPGSGVLIKRGSTTEATVPFTPAGDSIWIRLSVSEVEGDPSLRTVRARVWDSGDFQPSTWDYEDDLDALVENLGKGGLFIELGSGDVCDVDNITFGDGVTKESILSTLQGGGSTRQAIRIGGDNLRTPQQVSTKFRGADGDPPFGIDMWDMADFVLDDGSPGSSFDRTIINSSTSAEEMWGWEDSEFGRCMSGITYDPPPGYGVELGMIVPTYTGLVDTDGPQNVFYDVALIQIGLVFGCDPSDTSDHIALTLMSDITLSYAPANTTDAQYRIGNYFWNIASPAPNYYPESVSVFHVYWTPEPLGIPPIGKHVVRIVDNMVAYWYNDTRIMYPTSVPELYRDRNKYGLAAVMGYNEDRWVLQPPKGILDDFWVRPYSGDLGAMPDEPATGSFMTLVEQTSANSITLKWPSDAPVDGDGKIVAGTRVIAVVGKGNNSNSNTVVPPANGTWKTLSFSPGLPVSLGRLHIFEHICNGTEVPGEDITPFVLSGTAAGLIGTTAYVSGAHTGLWGSPAQISKSVASTVCEGPTITQLNQPMNLAIWCAFVPSAVDITAVPTGFTEQPDFVQEINGGTNMRLCVATAVMVVPDGLKTNEIEDVALHGGLASSATNVTQVAFYYADPR